VGYLAEHQLALTCLGWAFCRKFPVRNPVKHSGRETRHQQDGLGRYA